MVRCLMGKWSIAILQYRATQKNVLKKLHNTGEENGAFEGDEETAPSEWSWQRTEEEEEHHWMMFAIGSVPMKMHTFALGWPATIEG